MNNRRRRREKTVRILKLIGIGALLLGIGAVPSPRAVSRLLKELILKDTPQNRRKVYQHVYHLKRQGYLRDRNDVYEISTKGQKVVDTEDLWKLSIPVPRHWDLAWHIVLFDIPQSKSKVRIQFIRHLQQLGLVFYQRSVWIHPYPLEKEVLKVARFYGIEPHVSFVTALNIDGYGSLKRRFKLQ